MIASCPSSWTNTTTARACISTNHSADPAEALPVLDMTTKVTYANIYCAMCHGKSRDLHHWNLQIARTLKGTPTLQDTRSADTKWEVIPVGGITPYKCVLTPSEANTGLDTKIKRLCRSYSNVIIDDDRTVLFKNPHCALLTNPNMLVNKSFRYYMDSRFPSKLPSTLFVFSKLHKKPSYTPSGAIVVRVKFNCQINEVYDPFQKRCLSVHSGHSDSNNDTNTTDQCRGPRFPSNEFLVLSNNSVLIIPLSKVYNNNSYILVNQTLILCSNVSRNYTSRNDPKKITPAETAEKPPSHVRALALRVLTYVGFSLSIIALYSYW
ncbi:hypothetical protein OS493_003845 [Desmophyllum pertusum]|uniref:Uncharacterized protein n=1 Tax=Desmophyllum pertusum TaxID=174260 RepID=A0A9X0DC27_9CNID|nr:hypothetical protein OS493_003845 [Desmophyllum pertusum]